MHADSGDTNIINVFVIMPFAETVFYNAGEEVNISSKQWSYIYENWIKRAVESYQGETLKAKRSPALPGNFVRGIVQDLATSDLVIADLTGGKPNVYYELGIRHSLRTGTVIMTQDLKSLPSDLNGYYAFEYLYTEKAHETDEFYKRFEAHLHEKIQSVLSGQILTDSPVSDFLGFRAFALERSAKQEKAELLSLLNTFSNVRSEHLNLVKDLEKLYFSEEGFLPQDWMVIDTFPLESIYNRVISKEWAVIPYESIEMFSEHIRIERKAWLGFNDTLTWFRATGSEESVLALGECVKIFVHQGSPEIEAAWQGVVESFKSVGLVLSVDGLEKARIDL